MLEFIRNFKYTTGAFPMRQHDPNPAIGENTLGTSSLQMVATIRCETNHILPAPILQHISRIYQDYTQMLTLGVTPHTEESWITKGQRKISFFPGRRQYNLHGSIPEVPQIWVQISLLQHTKCVNLEKLPKQATVIRHCNEGASGCDTGGTV